MSLPKVHRPPKIKKPLFREVHIIRSLKSPCQSILKIYHLFLLVHCGSLQWKKQLLEHAPEIFSKDRKSVEGPNVKELHAKIGQLAMENDFLAGALGRIGDASAKR